MTGVQISTNNANNPQALLHVGSGNTTPEGAPIAFFEGDLEVTGTISGATILGQVGVSTDINTTAPLAGGGNLSGDLTLSINAATTSTPGSMSAADKTKLDAATSSATVQTICLRDASGRINVADPGSANHATTKNYVDTAIANLNALFVVKVPVRAATTAFLASFIGEQTIDDIALVTGDRILVKNQTGAFQGLNGIWVIASGSWTRATDFNEDADLISKCLIPVVEGTVNAASIWQLSTLPPIELGDDLAFTKALPYLAGTGLDIDAANTLTVDLTEISAFTTLESNFGSLTSNKNAHTVYSGPVSGAAAAPAFRTLKAADAPSRLTFQCFGIDTQLTVADGVMYFPVPPSMAGKSLTYVHAFVRTPGTGSGTTNIQITRITLPSTTVSMLSTVCSVDISEYGSDTALAPAVINTSNDDLTAHQVLRIDITAVTSTAPYGLIVTLEFEE